MEPLLLVLLFACLAYLVGFYRGMHVQFKTMALEWDDSANEYHAALKEQIEYLRTLISEQDPP